MFWTAAQEVSRTALKAGSLMPIATQTSTIHQRGVTFRLHLKGPHAHQKPAPGERPDNPFLPYDPAMYVADAGPSHVCLLNKFPVLSPHLLICTRTFVAQTTPLTLSDFQAWAMGFDSPNTLGFYNSGPLAGASQTHRHMQLVQTDIPLEETILHGGLPFPHHLSRFETFSAAHAFDAYQQALHTHKHTPCNILLTNRWLLLVPRRLGHINGVSVNGINYSGCFLVNDLQQAEWLSNYGPMRLLTECSESPTP
ncbi:MAG: phosphorylase [Myxococcota bacterium]|nr:phosphorylase [Myxococcota bacterium]